MKCLRHRWTIGTAGIRYVYVSILIYQILVPFICRLFLPSNGHRPCLFSGGQISADSKQNKYRGGADHLLVAEQVVPHICQRAGSERDQERPFSAFAKKRGGRGDKGSHIGNKSKDTQV